MKKIITTAVIALGTLFILGCGGSSTIDDIADNIKNGVFKYDRNETISDNTSTYFDLNVTTNIISLTDIDVSLYITHNNTAKLRIYLISPSGRSILLSYQRACDAQ